MKKNDGMTSELGSWFEDEASLGSQVIDSKLVSAGFDPLRVAQRSKESARVALAAARRQQAGENYRKAVQLIDQVRHGLLGVHLAAAIEELRKSLPAGIPVQSLATYRSLTVAQELGQTPESSGPAKEEILLDLMALKKLLEALEDEGGDGDRS